MELELELELEELLDDEELDGIDGMELLELLEGTDGVDALELGDDEGMLGIDGEDEEEADGMDGMLLEDWLWLLLEVWQPINSKPRPPTSITVFIDCVNCCRIMSLFPVLRPHTDIGLLKQLWGSCLFLPHFRR